MSVALIAGEGSLPEEIARRLAERDDKAVVYAIRENYDALVPYAKEILPLFRTELAATLRDIASRGLRQVMFAGLVPKTLMYRPAMMDNMAREFVAALSERDDHSLLGGIVDLFEKTGFEVIGYRDILEDLLAREGKIVGRDVSEAEMSDVAYGIDIARTVVPLSFGQSVVVHKKSVVAVEAMEGTDATILRAGSICKGGVVVKMIKQGQDERYDIPTVGPQTLRLMARAGLTCLALQKGWTLILCPDEFRAVAEEENVAVIGIDY